MQTNNRKNQNQQLPDQVAATPVITTCFLEGKEGTICSHRGCYLLTHKSKYYQSISIWYEKYKFSHFDVQHSKYDDKVFLVPHNPFSKVDVNWNGFEIYRQALNSVIEGRGLWPVGLKLVDKNDVAIKNVEYKDYKGIWSPTQINANTAFELDIREYAFYTPTTKGGRQDGL